MKKKNYKGRCEKRMLSKSEDVCRLFSKIQSAYADLLEANDEIVEFRCNVPLEGLDIGEYTSDFVCKKTDGTYRVRECVERKNLSRPHTVKLLDASIEYWTKRRVEDWGIVIDKEKTAGEEEEKNRDE